MSTTGPLQQQLTVQVNIINNYIRVCIYRIAGMFGSGKFGESSLIHQTLTSQILADKWYPYGQNLSIRQTVFRQLLLIWQFAKH